MASADRSSITNAIWLCGNCHKLVDDDPARYPAGLLFEWQRDHERRVAEQVGKAGAELRRRYEERHLEELGHLSYLAERIVIEKGKHWEYRLTSEMLRVEMSPILRRWDALSRRLYMKPNYRVDGVDFLLWAQTRNEEVLQILCALSELLNVEFAKAWGDPGVPGVDTSIVSTCRLFSGICASAIEWEESVRFANVDTAFDEVKALMVGVAGGLIEEAAKVPAYLAQVFSSDPEPGEYHLQLTFRLPEGWNEAVSSALDRAVRALRLT